MIVFQVPAANVDDASIGAERPKSTEGKRTLESTQTTGLALKIQELLNFDSIKYPTDMLRSI